MKKLIFLFLLFSMAATQAQIQRLNRIFIKKKYTDTEMNAMGYGASDRVLIYNTTQDQFMWWDGDSWEDFGGTGGGTPGGSDTQVQYNNSGAFAGDAGFVYDAVQRYLKLGLVDSDAGIIQAFGNGAASTQGGILLIDTAADHDTSIANFRIEALSDDLSFGRWMGTNTPIMTYDGTNGRWRFDEYGGGTITGTATFSLAVDSAGNIIEEPLGAGDNLGNHTATQDLEVSGFDIFTNDGLIIDINRDGGADQTFDITYNNGANTLLNLDNNADLRLGELDNLTGRITVSGNASTGGGILDLENSAGEDTNAEFWQLLANDHFQIWKAGMTKAFEINSSTLEPTFVNYIFDADQTVGAGQDNYVLTYDNGTGKIALEAAAGGGASQLSDLSDVNTSTPTNRNVLVADGVDWESRALVEADISDLAHTAVSDAAYNESTWNGDTGAASKNAIRDQLEVVDTNAKTDVIIIACSDLTTAITTGDGKAYFHAPFAFTLDSVEVGLDAPGTATGITVDIEEEGVSVLSTLLTTDATEDHSSDATTAAVISDSAIAQYSKIGINFDAVPTAATGVIVYLHITRN